MLGSGDPAGTHHEHQEEPGRGGFAGLLKASKGGTVGIMRARIMSIRRGFMETSTGIGNHLGAAKRAAEVSRRYEIQLAR